MPLAGPGGPVAATAAPDRAARPARPAVAPAAGDSPGSGEAGSSGPPARWTGGQESREGNAVSNKPESTFDASIDKTNLLLKEIEQAYGWPKERRNQSYAALRTVLHLLRDRLPVQESAHFAAQLPTLVRGVYFEGWDPTVVPVKLNRDEFLYEVRQNFPYDVAGGAEGVVRTVLGALRRHIPQGEWDDVRATVPNDLAAVVP
ncbi:DUF2267 domain-containing protein [Plantactinospora siamensis]|uniref:DUF2267 domain-containing protein n=1 Tax=Plantactinospora siamensis TaxID=555372 RepID=A0ABV6P219_9ACTN